ncbi:MAG: enoyl-[acyl-carrier-protein] reductase FabK [Paraclostridium bifermentans]|uniref:Probable nitronate monooxygenase n=1 Tax=Paraclostridium bifermentans ATCC 638 = DSM 14991 TaxID=1233171 RepID=T4VQN7_PARBF|nr:enoyl-[acyl-carrier-protein] reductase FabK [Paraclostridium bifermentans]EQK43808.1 nitronate monooxygenase family protein [[Clostridium] bifermentans ATCC 638] [Paraclostridium bifermentans ATCC 638 = DSM 14991]MBS6507746.1 enoyl-[acyl-carrier-protein] reductase FabK [Paraclostridium bifermentans]MDU3802519.1 enoyl-[acyl-carrier-protein] reductase FabK [Paraclostridium bifermentans]RIZ59497.1 nitronate monooxygenase [Paraclostridium bifermentans]UAG17638.1 enoyl-[acyl-carrier-protein] red
MKDLCELLNIKYPIIQGGMAWVATAELAAGVSNAGGLGIIAAGNAPKEVIKEQIKKCRKLTDKPFGVNVMLLSPFVDEIMDLIVEERVEVITTGAGNPAKYIERLKEVNTKIIPVVPTIALAKRMEKHGADAVIVEGTEAGGHIGELTTMVLTPQVVDNVNIPVIAAGGIADGKGLAAALCLGASGVQIGTRFICSDECIAHENYKNLILKSRDRDAIVTGRSTGHPVRTLKNKLAKEILNMEKEGVNPLDIDQKGVGSLRMAVVNGDVDNGSFMAGQIASYINDVKPCKQIIEDIMEESKSILSKINKKLEV